MARRSERYDNAFSATRDVVNKHDPIGLIEGGAPTDEYEPEVNDLVRMVLGVDPIDDAAVDEVWVRWFGDSYTMSGSAALRALSDDLRALQDRFATR
jgi:hypothetical protein